MRMVVPVRELRRALRSVVFAGGTGCNWNFVIVHPVDGGVRFVGTNGHHMAMYIAQCECEKDEGERMYFLEGPAARWMASRLPREGYVELSWEGWQNWSCAFDGQTLSGTAESIEPLTGPFLSYWWAIPPTTWRSVLTVKKADLARVLKDLLLPREPFTKVLAVPADGSLVLRSDAGSGSIPCHFEGERISVAFNARYMLGALKAWRKRDVELCIEGPPKPITISNESWLYVLMPMEEEEEEIDEEVKEC